MLRCLAIIIFIFKFYRVIGMKMKVKNKWRLIFGGVLIVLSFSLLEGCTVQPILVAHRAHCYHCHWHHHWHRHANCWLNHRGVMHCRG